MKQFFVGRMPISLIGVAILAAAPACGGVYATLSSVTHVYAAGPCTTYKDETDGYIYVRPSNIWGSRAWIVTRPASFCSGTDPDPETDFITAWAMVDAGSGHYAQSGYFKYRGSSSYSFYAEDTDTSCPKGWCRTLNGTTTDGDNVQYFDAYNTSVPNEIEGYDIPGGDEWLLQGTTYDPNCGSCAQKWPEGWESDFGGETWDSRNDIPGTASEKTTFTNVAWEASQWDGTGLPSYTDVGTNPSPTSNNTTCYTGGNTGSSSFNIWSTGSC